LSTRVHVDGDGEVAEVATAFNDMAAGLEQAQAEQRAFLASVGHELKTPLTTVQGYTEALLDGTVDDPADRRRSLLRVHAETIRLARLVQDLLDLARLGRGQFAVSTVDSDVGAVLREAAAAAAPDPVAERLALDIAHDEEHEATRFTDAMDRDDVRMGQAGRERALRLFDWDRTAEQFEEIYREVASRMPR
jgi:signal transduction histidine kinase